jgi:hypothetical protein
MYEEDDSVFRDIDIKPSHTFSDLEAVIQSSYNLPMSGAGEFFMSNDNWQKGKSIHPQPVKEEKKGKARVQMIPTIVSYIDDPHQHFLYEYTGAQEFIFLIELISVGGKEDFKASYPYCVRSQGASPFKKEEMPMPFARHPVPVVPDDEEEEEAPEEESPGVMIGAEDEEELEAETQVEDEKHDLMEGDAIEVEKDEDAGDEEFIGGDDFSSEDFNEGGDEFEEDEFR